MQGHYGHAIQHAMKMSCSICRRELIIVDRRRVNTQVRRVTSDGHVMYGRRCHLCLNAYMRGEYRNGKRKESIKNHSKTLNGYLMRTYRNMLSRVTGVTKHKNHLYLGLEILPKLDFYKWSLENSSYKRLHRKWTLSGMDTRLSPSIDRIDPYRGYSLDNMRWVTKSFNSRNTRKYQSNGIKIGPRSDK